MNKPFRLFLCLMLAPILSFSQDKNDDPNFVRGQQLMDKSLEYYPAQLDSFRVYREQALPFLKKAEAWQSYIECYNGLSQYYYQKGNYDQLKESSLKAIALTEKHLGKNNTLYAECLNNYGVFLRQRGDLEAAKDYYQKALKVELALNTSIHYLAISYANLATNFRRMGDYKYAIDYYNKAIQLRKDTITSSTFETARLFLYKGHCYRDMKEFSTAKKDYHLFLKMVAQEEEAIQSKATKSLVYCYQSLAKIFLQENNRDSTNYYLDQVLVLESGKNSSREMQNYEVLGDLHTQEGSYKKALAAYQKAHTLGLERYRKYDKHYSKSHNLKQVGEAHFHLGNIEEALATYQEALILLSFDFSDTSVFQYPDPQSMLSPRKGLEIIANKAKTFYAKYQKEKDQIALRAALDHYQFAGQLITLLRQSFLAEGSKELLAGKALPIYEGGIACALELHRLSEAKQYLDDAFAFAEQNKAILLLESLQEADAKLSGAIPDSELEQEQQLRIDIAFYEKQINKQKQKSKTANSEKISSWQNKLFDLQRQYQSLIDHFEKSYPQYYELKYNTHLADANSLRDYIIDDKTLLLEYFIGQENSYLFCLSDKDLQVWPLPTNDHLHKNINTLLQLISQAPQPENFIQDCKTFANTSWALSQHLLEPVRPSLSPQIQHLIIVPDDVLALLPFELLLEKEAPEAPTDFYENTFAYLQNNRAISYNYSASLLQNHRGTNNADRKNFVGFAPSFDSPIAQNTRACTGSELSSLQCNQQEVEGIKQLFSGQSFLSQAASQQTFLEEAGQYRIIHLATHACAGEEDMGQNKIHFADDFLSNKDLHNLQLQADLAVLSACNTGSGKLVKGEGVMSLSRGFILAGCPSTLMSLWSVDDCTTSDLMLHFYRGLKNGLRKDESLRQAKIQHLQSADKATAHPYYWAAFVQSGHPAPMDLGNRTWGRAGWLGVLLLLFIGGFFYFKT